MTDLLKRAEEIDQERFEENQKTEEIIARTAAWNQRVKAVLLKLEKTPADAPTDLDLKKLELVEHFLGE